MKTSSAKHYKCRRCKAYFFPVGKEKLCFACLSSCSKCGVTLTKENRETSALTNRSYYVCKQCVAATVKRTRNKDKQKEYDLLRHYSLTFESYQKMKEEQQGKCKICERPSLKLVVDHCHTTGKVRGLLCHPCNKGLGHFEDNGTYLWNAIKYLGQK